jgi:hypothetical protein
MASARHVFSRSGHKLARVGFFDAKKMRNLTIGMVERLSKHKRRALGRQKLL